MARGRRLPAVAEVALLTNLLEYLAPADRERLLAIGAPRLVACGEELARQGIVGETVFVVASGELEIVRRVPGNEEELLETAPAGTLVGELAVLDRRPRSASLRAKCGSEVHVIERGAFERLLLDGGDTGFRILQAVAVSLHDRLAVARSTVATRFESASAATWPLAAPIMPVAWTGDPVRAPVTPSLRAFALLDPADLAALDREMPQAHLAPHALFRFFDASEGSGVVLLRGAVSPCIATAAGEAIALPVVSPGGFVAHVLARGRAGPEPFWRARGEVVVARLPAHCFNRCSPRGARLLFALCRDLARTLRSTTGLLMHLGMAWRHARVAEPLPVSAHS